jgi:GNAT superfamily N-acetyltransferase
MLSHPVDVRIVTAWKTEEIVGLYKAVGWWKDWYDPAGVPLLVEKSFAFAVAVERVSGRAVGMGRVLSDGVSDGYIQDVVVLPEFRKHAVGGEIIRVLVEACVSRGVTWVGLIAVPGSVPFYEACGFRSMLGHTPMLYQGSG